MDDLVILDSYMKSPGGVEKQKKKCGKPNCHCAKGTHLHRAYCYRYYKFENGRYLRKRKYINKEMYIKIGKALKRYKAQCPMEVYEYHINRIGFMDMFRVGYGPDEKGTNSLAIPMNRFLR